MASHGFAPGRARWTAIASRLISAVREHFLESITLLATEVKPRVERLLARKG